MDTLRVRPWRPADDADAVAALSSRYFAPDPAWTPAVARAQLAIDALGGGAQVAVATRGARVVGVCGHVVAPPFLYVFPLAADDAEAIGALFDAACAAGRGPGVEQVKVSVRAGEPHKAEALAARGLASTMYFAELRRAATPALHAPALGLTVVGADALDRAAAHALHDDAFVGVDNAAPISAADFAAYLDGPTAWPAATAAWLDDGRPVGLVIGARAPQAGVVEAITVAPTWRGRGLGRAMLAHVLATAAAEGLAEVAAMIASTNHASLALHTRAGFVERARKEVWVGAL